MTTERWNELMDETQVASFTQAELADGWHFCQELDGCLHGPQPGGPTECWCGHKMKSLPPEETEASDVAVF